eukprot:CAMPEP_0194443728 /NCGR_PEP_ID=MMETSP0176-20130528/126869_1 /TAXON_ID=216777 /ORGANISM="Proboscia alata, Strain PI-D3" /LENGTH=1495 /DNA_ID=CAMNT_0039270017 /DNA_START=354 /DNA_END=4842 /DNA_ORIENTATION=-
MDRFSGYPDHPGYADDKHVPFFDIYSQTNIYPLRNADSGEILKFDWQTKPNVTSENYHEHIQESRWNLYGQESSGQISTSHAIYRMQGQCDPSVSDLMKKAIIPDTNLHLYRGSADVAVILKPLYEFYQDIRVLGVYFANSGAGSVVSFPASVSNGKSSYKSIGCDWSIAMNSSVHLENILSNEERQRCHTKGAKVPSREYNPLERSWCRDQALNPNKSHISGPYLDAFAEDLWIMTIGRAAYDRITGKFIACTLADVDVLRLTKVVTDVKIGNTSQVTLVKWSDGTVIASSQLGPISTNEAYTVSNPKLGLDVNKFNEVKLLVNSTDELDLEKFTKEATYRNGDKLISHYPIQFSSINIYDSNHYPEFMIIISIDIAEEFSNVEGNHEIKSYREIVVQTLVVGIAGSVVIVIIIFAVSMHVTRPLQRMNNIGGDIINNIGSAHNDDQDNNIHHTKCFSLSMLRRCTPQTEVTELGEEFENMVQQFSGKGTANLDQQHLTDILNPFDIFDECQDLYNSRKEKDLKHNYFVRPVQKSEIDSGVNCGANNDVRAQETLRPRRIYLGSNITTSDNKHSREKKRKDSLKEDKGVKLASPFFWWVIRSIIIPLIITLVVISIFVCWYVSRDLYKLIDNKEKIYMELMRDVLRVNTKLRSQLATETMKMTSRDLHLLSRVASWLFFGAIERSDSFTEMRTGADECKIFPDDGTSCSYYRDAQCDCNWFQLISDRNCSDYENKVSRDRQKVVYEGQSQNTGPNGDRNSTTFPYIAKTPETVAFWSDVNSVPGSDKGSTAQGYETTYDRLRVMSALSVVQMPLFNNNKGHRDSYIGFDADGMLLGYPGCDHSHAEYAHWQSTEENGAYLLQPSLCPKGKFGYDARCRDWYHTGKKRYEEKGTWSYYTAPYEFAGSKSISQSASMSLIDPDTGKHIGQALVDFSPQQITEMLTDKKTPLVSGGFHILVTVEQDNFQNDTIVGPGKLVGETGVIGDYILPNDFCTSELECSLNRQSLDKILVKMRSGGTGIESFYRTSDNGAKESIYISYAPVYATTYSPIDSSNFARGVNESSSVIFSLALAIPETSMLESFKSKKSLLHTVNVAVAVLSVILFVVACLVTYTSYYVSLYVTTPILELLNLTRKINRGDIKHDLPGVKGESFEMKRVCDTFDKLYKIIRFANAAYFSGELDKAYAVLIHALDLFVQVENRKAIGIANNNLGDTMLTMYRVLKITQQEQIHGMSKEDLISKGKEYFDEAINSGEKAIAHINDEEGWSTNYLLFMQQLSNRYFNRALFLLTIREDYESSEEAERLGFIDLATSKDMDIEVVDNGDQVGFKGSGDVRYELLLGRIRGILSLMKMSLPDKWGIEELFTSAVDHLVAASRDLEDVLFHGVLLAGRMQAIDTLLIEYLGYIRGDTAGAARISIRMLIDDEYVQPDAAVRAVEMVMKFFEKQEVETTQNEEIQKKLAFYKAYFEDSPVLSERRKNSTIDSCSIRDTTIENL